MTVLPSQPSTESLPERLRVGSCRYAHETQDDAAMRRIKTDLEAAARIEEMEAGEKALRDEIFCLRNIVTDVRIMANAGQFKQFEGEPWLKRARNIDLHHDPVATDVAFRAALEPEKPL